MRHVIARLTESERQEYEELCIEEDAIETATEVPLEVARQHFRESYDFWARILEKYDLESTEGINIDPFTGAIFVDM